MEEMMVIKGPNNCLLPATDEDAETLKRYKLGQGITVRTTKVSANSLKFHQRTIMLFRLCYDIFCERSDTGTVYKGEAVRPSFGTFRGEMTILAGHYTPVYSMNGSFRREPKSISYAKCTDPEKEKLYSSVINAALKHIYGGSMPEEVLRNRIDQLMAFDQ